MGPNEYMICDYRVRPDKVTNERPTSLNAGVGSAPSIHWDLGWRQDTGRGQR